MSGAGREMETEEPGDDSTRRHFSMSGCGILLRSTLTTHPSLRLGGDAAGRGTAAKARSEVRLCSAVLLDCWHCASNLAGGWEWSLADKKPNAASALQPEQPLRENGVDLGPEATNQSQNGHQPRSRTRAGHGHVLDVEAICVEATHVRASVQCTMREVVQSRVFKLIPAITVCSR